MTGQVIGWVVTAVAGLGLAWVVCLAIGRWGRLRYLAGGLVLAWSLTPFNFDGVHVAPAFAVVIFRAFLEDGLDPMAPLVAMGVVTVGVIAVYLVVLGGVVLWRRRRGLS